MSQAHKSGIYSAKGSETPDRIIGIQFSILSPEEIRKSSVAEITSRDTYVNNRPVIGGLFDPRMGVLEPGLICPTDGLNYMQTPGYFGHIELARPVFYIQYLTQIIKTLRCICFRCSKLLISKEDHRHILELGAKKRWEYVFARASEIARCGDENEDGCGCLQPHKLQKEGLATVFAHWKFGKEIDEEEPIKIIKVVPEIALKILRRMTDDDIQFMGYSPVFSRPESMICQVLAVPPPAVRPSVKHDAQQRSEDDLTHILVNIVKANRTLQEKMNQTDENGQGVDPKLIDDWTTVLQYFVATMVNNKLPGVASVTQRSGRAFKSIVERLNGKTGRVRGNLMGKRVDFSARSVITPDANLSIRELGVPMKIAMNLTQPSIVNERNRDYLNQLVINGPDVYPGAKILEKKNGDNISLRHIDRESLVLEDGDTVHRHMIDGDMVLFNRQPTLHRMSMMGHEVKVMNEGNTFRMNVADTKPYNADFDGDEMNLHAPQDEEAVSELRNLAAVPRQIISPANNSSIVGIFQDSLLGAYRFTREGINFTPRQAMNLLMYYPNIQEEAFLNPQRTLSSFDILTQFIPSMSTYFTNGGFDSDEDKQTSNNVIEIKNGKYLRGQLDKGALGSGSNGMIQRIFNDFGFKASADFIDYLQGIVTEYMKESGYSVGISDLIADPNTNRKIAEAITRQKQEAMNTIEELHVGVFENNTGKTNYEEFETRMNSILNKAREEGGKIGRKSLSKDNRFVIMVNAGSKGNNLNIVQMISCLGQQNVDGKRIPYGLEGRTLPHFPKYDDSPEARGFVETSFVQGLSPQELFFHAMGGREGLIDTAVKSVSWDTPVILIENNTPKYVSIGQWIDDHLNINSTNVEQYDETQMNMEYLDLTSNVYIPTTDEQGNVSWGQMTAINRHDPGRQLYKIKTQSGRDVIITASKSLIVWNQNTSQFEEKACKDIRQGDFLPTNMKIQPFCENYQISMESYFSKTEYHTREHARIPDQFDLSFKNGQMCGLYLAEGNIDNSTIYITNSSNQVKEFVKEWFTQFNVATKETNKTNHIGGKTHTVIGHSSFLSTFFERTMGKGSSTKHLPHFTFTSNNEFIKGILSGYFTRDGCISKNSIEISSASKQLIDEISFLCNYLGIFTKYNCSICKQNNLNTQNIKPSHRLFIRSQWASIFKDTIPLICENKQRQLYDCIPTGRHRNFTPLNDIVLDKITIIEPISPTNHTKMYDITVPSTLNFMIANGLHVRDTSQTGYIQRRLIKGLEDMKVVYDMTVRNVKNKIVQFSYGDDNMDSAKVENQFLPITHMTTEQIYAHFLIPEGTKSGRELIQNVFTKEIQDNVKREKNQYNQAMKEIVDEMVIIRDVMITNVFDGRDDKKVHYPVHLKAILENVENQLHLTHTSQSDITLMEAFELIDDEYQYLDRLPYTRPSPLFKALYYYYLNPKELVVIRRFHRDAIQTLLLQIRTTYMRSIVSPGEMVGLIAAQSIGEPTTQLTLNSFIYETPVIIRNEKQEIKTIQMGEFVEILCDKGKNHETKIEYYKENDTTYAPVPETEYWEIQAPDKDGTIKWYKIEAGTRHPVINKDGTNTMLKIITEDEREIVATKAKSFLMLKDGLLEPTRGDELVVGDYVPVSIQSMTHSIIQDYCKEYIPNKINGEIQFEKRENKMKDITFMKIKSITEVSNTTNYAYDLTVEKVRTFVSENGLCLQDTFHFSGISSKSGVTRGVPRIEEILALSENPKNPSMTVFLKKEEQEKQERVMELMHRLEHTSLRDVTSAVSICFDPQDDDTRIEEDRVLLEQYKMFKSMVKECIQEDEDEKEKQNIARSNWIIRFEIDREELLERNITMDDIYLALQGAYKQDIECIYSDMNDDNLIIRVRQLEKISKNKQKTLDQNDEIYKLKNIQDTMLNGIILRGIRGIGKVMIRKIPGYMVEHEGGYEPKDIWVLDTMGTNLMDILANQEVDTTRTYTNDLMEIYRTLGIEAVRQTIYAEFADVLGGYINYHHLSMLCDRMTMNYKPTSIFRHGINNDDIGALAKASFEETPKMFLEAAQHGELDPMSGVSANVMCGQEAGFGTGLFDIVIDTNRMIQHESNEFKKKKELDELFDTEDPNDPCAISNITINHHADLIQPKQLGQIEEDYDAGF